MVLLCQFLLILTYPFLPLPYSSCLCSPRSCPPCPCPFWPYSSCLCNKCIFTSFPDTFCPLSVRILPPLDLLPSGVSSWQQCGHLRIPKVIGIWKLLRAVLEGTETLLYLHNHGQWSVNLSAVLERILRESLHCHGQREINFGALLLNTAKIQFLNY